MASAVFRSAATLKKISRNILGIQQSFYHKMTNLSKLPGHEAATKLASENKGDVRYHQKKNKKTSVTFPNSEKQLFNL